jgi:hypothetical protein
MKNIHGNLIRVDKKFFFRDTSLSRWVELAGGGTSTDTTSLSNRINSKADTSLLSGFVSFSDTITLIATKSDIISPIDTTSLSNRIDGKLSISDTATMLSSYLLKQDTVSLSNRIDLKLNISDTSTMLSPYLKAVDTASLSDRINAIPIIDTTSLSNRIDLKLNISDTSTMLSPYARANDIDLQFVTDNGGITNDTIGVYGVDFYDVVNDESLLLNVVDYSLQFKKPNNSSIFLASPETFGYWNPSGFPTNLTFRGTASRDIYFPDSSGTVALLSNLDAKVNISDTSVMLAGYIRSSIFPIATFGGGSGAAGDTSVFTTDAIYGSFYNAGTDSIVVTSIDTVQRSGSVTTTVYYNTSIDTSGATTVTAGSTIPPAKHVWVQTTAITTKPTYYSVTLNGYRKR